MMTESAPNESLLDVGNENNTSLMLANNVSFPLEKASSDQEKRQNPSSRHLAIQKLERISKLKAVTNITKNVEDNPKLKAAEFLPIQTEDFYSKSPGKYSQTPIQNSSINTKISLDTTSPSLPTTMNLPSTVKYSPNIASHSSTSTSPSYSPTDTKSSFTPINCAPDPAERLSSKLSLINHCSPSHCSSAKRSKCDISKVDSEFGSKKEICDSALERDETAFYVDESCFESSYKDEQDSGVDFEDEYIVSASFSSDIIYSLNKEFLMRSLSKTNSKLIQSNLSSEIESESEEEISKSDLETDDSIINKDEPEFEHSYTDESNSKDSAIDFDDEFIVAGFFPSEMRHALNNDILLKSLSHINLEPHDEKVINLTDDDKDEPTATWAQTLEEMENEVGENPDKE